MDHVALRLPGTATWVHLGGKDDARKPLEVVVRAFDAEVDFAAGESGEAPGDEIVRVPAGEGRRLTGRHFFVRSGTGCRITYRGV